MIRVLIADPFKTFCECLKIALREDNRISLDMAHDETSALKILESSAYDILITEADDKHLNGIKLIKAIAEKNIQTRTLVFTNIEENSTIRKAVEFGANGYVPKTADLEELKIAIRSLDNGENYFKGDILNTILSMINVKTNASTAVNGELTPREKEIVSLISQGHKTTEVAAKLFISHHTVNVHRKNILKKLNVKNTAGLIKYVFEKGLLG